MCIYVKYMYIYIYVKFPAALLQTKRHHDFLSDMPFLPFSVQKRHFCFFFA